MAKYKVLHLSWGNSRCVCRVEQLLESSPMEKNLVVLVDEEPDMSWQCMLAAQKTNCFLGCIKTGVVSRERLSFSILLF